MPPRALRAARSGMDADPQPPRRMPHAPTGDQHEQREDDGNATHPQGALHLEQCAHHAYKVRQGETQVPWAERKEKKKQARGRERKTEAKKEKGERSYVLCVYVFVFMCEREKERER